MIDFLERFSEKFTKVEFLIANSIFLVMLFLMLVQVITRYVFHYPLGWSEELIRFLFVACSFLGGAIATKKREQIEINVAEVLISNKTDDDNLRHKYGEIINIIRDSVTVIFLFVITLETWNYLIDIYEMQSVSSALMLPMWIVIVPLFLGILLCMLHSITLIILNLNGRGPTGFKFDEIDGGEIS